jgi:hypothetical protein
MTAAGLQRGVSDVERFRVVPTAECNLLDEMDLVMLRRVTSSF